MASIWKSNPDLMNRLAAAQNAPANINQDIMTFAALCETRQELEAHVDYYVTRAIKGKAA